MTESPDRVPTGTTHSRHTETRWAHRNLGGPWWLALLLLPLLLAALVTGIRGGAIGDDLKGRATAALEGAGLSGIDVDASGRDLTLSAADGSTLNAADADRARELVAGVDGVRVASLGDGLGGAAATGDADGDADGTSDETTDETTDGATAGETDGTEGTDGATDGETDGTEGTDGATDGESEGTDGGVAGGANCEVAAAQAGIDKALGADFIQFDELRRIPNDASKAEIAAVAELLAPCTDLAVTVTGYTDKFGSKKLSMARAINVSTLLVDGGVTSDIQKVGGHFTRELGDNETQAGRDMNRFATITVG